MSNRHGSQPLAAALADQHSAATSVRVIRLADGTTITHEVGPISWQDAVRFTRTPTTTTEDDK